MDTSRREPLWANTRVLHSQCIGNRLVRVSCSVSDEVLTELHLYFDHIKISVSVDADNDEIRMSVRGDSATNEGESVGTLLHEYIGESVQWGWACVNQQGYCDAIAFAFQGNTPDVWVVAVASELKIVEMPRSCDRRG
jgi:Family of unknown function (DUF6334)